MPRKLNPKPGAPCFYCAKPVNDEFIIQVYLAHSNGGAYGTSPAHETCHTNTKCPYCGLTARNDYGFCKECGRDHEGREDYR